MMRKVASSTSTVDGKVLCAVPVVWIMKALPALLFGSLSVLVLTAFGCGSSSSDTSSDSGADGASTGADSGRDGGTSGDGATRRDGGDAAVSEGGDAGTCAMPLTNFTAATYVPAVPAATAVCAPTDITTFLAACVDNTDPALCNTWLDTNLKSDAGAGTNCGNCIFNATNSGAGWIDPNLYAAEKVYVFNPNYAACIQLTDTTNGAACGGAFNNLRSCEDVACNSCSDAAFPACQAEVDQGDCKTYNDTTITDCVHDVGDGGAYSTCMPSTAPGGKLDDDWKLIIGMVCGG
jgi:hypothetical protein